MSAHVRRATYDAGLAALPDDAFVWFSKQGWMDAGWEQGDFCLEYPDPNIPAELRVPTDGPY